MRLYFSTVFSFVLAMNLVWAQSDTVIVEALPDNSFSPSEIIIKSGQTVLWKNVGGFHNVNGAQNSYPGNPESFSNGEASNDNWEFAFTFDKPGFYQYRCDPHFNLGMVGEITVMADVVITEIMYNPPESGTDVFEYIELYNNGNTAVNLKDYRFLDGVTFTFPGFSLNSGAYVIIAEDAQAMIDNFGLTDVFEWQGSLSNEGETIALADPDGNIVDEVTYDNTGDWPDSPEGNGASLVLCDIAADNDDPQSWTGATTPTGVISGGVEILGNPGAASQCPGSGPVIRFVDASVEVDEGIGTVLVRIALANGEGTVSFDISADEGASTAANDEDYVFSAYTPSFQAGAVEDTLTIELTILEDEIGEDEEAIILNITNPSAGASIDPNSDTFTINIADNDIAIPNIVITEILYNNPGSGVDEYEFIELYNNGNSSVELEGYFFEQGIEFTFPAVSMAPQDFIIIAADSSLIEATFEVAAFQWAGSSGLRNSGETIELRSPSGATVDSVAYSNTAPWDDGADGRGPTLDLCDVNADNNDPTNWKAATAPTGVEINGVAVFATPGELRDNCDEIEDKAYPSYPIGLVTTNDADGVADSTQALVTLTGIVYGVNYNASNEGLSFTIIDELGDGINVFSRENPFNYTVAEGDEVQVKGEIVQLNGLTEIEPDSLSVLSTGNVLAEPSVVDSLGEFTESQFIKIEGLTIVEPSQWTNMNTGFDVDVTNGIDTFTMRIDSDTEVFGTSPPAMTFNLTGIGGQFDNSFPFTDDYNIFPRFTSDIEIVTSVMDPMLEKAIKIFPNPAATTITIEASTEFDELIIANVLGQRQARFTPLNATKVIDISDYHSGIYTFTFVKDKRIWTERVVIE